MSVLREDIGWPGRLSAGAEALMSSRSLCWRMARSLEEYRWEVAGEEIVGLWSLSGVPR